MYSPSSSTPSASRGGQAGPGASAEGTAGAARLVVTCPATAVTGLSPPSYAVFATRRRTSGRAAREPRAALLTCYTAPSGNCTAGSNASRAGAHWKTLLRLPSKLPFRAGDVNQVRDWYVLPSPLPMIGGVAAAAGVAGTHRVSRAGSSSAVSSSSSCIVTSWTWCLLGAIAPRARQPGGFTCPAPLWRRATDLVYAICRTYCTVTTVHYPFLGSVNAGESRLISGNHDGAF